MNNVTGNQLIEVYINSKISAWPENKMKYIRIDVRRLQYWFRDDVITESEMKRMPGFGPKRRQYVLEFMNVICAWQRLTNQLLYKSSQKEKRITMKIAMKIAGITMNAAIVCIMGYLYITYEATDSMSIAINRAIIEALI